MNEALTKKLYSSFDIQGVEISALNAALDYISDMFKYQAAGMTVDYIKESINDLTSVIFKSAGDKYLKAIQPEDEAVNRIKELRKALYNHDVFVPSADLKELLYLYGDIKTIRKKFAFFWFEDENDRDIPTNNNNESNLR